MLFIILLELRGLNMEWMNIEKISSFIWDERESNFSEIKIDNYTLKNINAGLEEISDLKQKCLKKLLNQKDNYIENVMLILETEAKIFNILGILIYCEFNKNNTLQTYQEKEFRYAFVDYITDIENYAHAYAEFGILPYFYDKNVNSMRGNFM